MMRFIIEKHEIWTQMVEIEAKDEEEAKLLVSRGQGLMLDETLEYSHDEWRTIHTLATGCCEAAEKALNDLDSCKGKADDKKR
jgi:hypothetical protein